MSTDIKPGQVWAWNDGRPTVQILHVTGSLAFYRILPAGEDHYAVPLSTLAIEAHLVTDGIATPAPLDPKSVHVGDTVTVRFIETGDVLTTKAYQPDDVTKPGEWVYLLGWPLNKPMGHGLAVTKFEILAIEPAPKKAPREQVVDILIDYSNERADDYDTADRIMAVVAPDEPRPLPTREHLAGALAHRYGDHDNLGDTDLSTQQNYLNDADAVLALLRGESR